MVSAVDIRDMEGWRNLDLKNYERGSVLGVNVLHFCQTYFLGQDYRKSSLAWGTFNWHKGHLPADILTNCKWNLLVLPEITEENKKKDKTSDNKFLWMLHHLMTRVNAALKNYKLKY